MFISFPPTLPFYLFPPPAETPVSPSPLLLSSLFLQVAASHWRLLRECRVGSSTGVQALAGVYTTGENDALP